jgi:starch phosphorylase
MERSEKFRRWGIFHKTYDAKGIINSFANHLEYSLSKDQYTATIRDAYFALSLAARDRLVEQWIKTQQEYYTNDVKRIYYLSAEFLMGRALVNNLINLELYHETRKAMDILELDFDALVEQEPDAGLGNGGLGRLAACFLDSMAALELPGYGYGIRYEFGIFEQQIKNCGQYECPDAWLKFGNPWEIERPEYSFTVKFYGRTQEETWPDGRPKMEWVDTKDVVGIAYDMPIAGYDNITVNTLRLWSARASNEFDLEYFQDGDYLKAVEEKNISENISKVLYPNDSSFEGKELRLKQEYFFVSCSVQDIVRRYLVGHDSFEEFPDKVAIQMNDTPPALTVPELMRVLMDEHGLEWDEAWDITQRTCAYTNHTLLAEALEEWPVSMLENLLPRHMQIINEINRRFLRKVSVKYVGDAKRQSQVSIIREGSEKRVCMAHLAFIGSHSTNGVAALHTRLLKDSVFKDFNELYPGRLNNKTNGITPRRWLLAANPALAALITGEIGKGWIKNLDDLKALEPLADDSSFQEKFRGVKTRNKEELATITKDLTGYEIDPASIFDVQVKRIHEYKRQLLNILHVIYTWLRLKEEDGFTIHPRTFIFGGKTAPDYYISKMVIKLICRAADVINGDPATNDRLRIIFLPNYRVTLAERIIPATDVSEQISTAGYEASGTGNMKLALNGAVTIGTLDGANIEIMEEVGEENIFIFGLTADEVKELVPRYNPKEYYEKDPVLKRAIDLIRSGFFSPQNKDLFVPLVDNLMGNDRYLVLADFEAYRDCQERVCRAYRDRDTWTRMAILNVARMGKFSSDRTIREYNNEIWGAKPLTIEMEEPLVVTERSFIDEID